VLLYSVNISVFFVLKLVLCSFRSVLALFSVQFLHNRCLTLGFTQNSAQYDDSNLMKRKLANHSERRGGSFLPINSVSVSGGRVGYEVTSGIQHTLNVLVLFANSYGLRSF